MFAVEVWDGQGKEGRACSLVSFFHLKISASTQNKGDLTVSRNNKRDLTTARKHVLMRVFTSIIPLCTDYMAVLMEEQICCAYVKLERPACVIDGFN